MQTNHLGPKQEYDRRNAIQNMQGIYLRCRESVIGADKFTRNPKSGFREEKTPELLFHYTRTKNAKEIVEGSQLFFTHHTFMNDRLEVIGGLHIALKEIQRKCDALVREGNQRTANYLTTIMKALVHGLGTEEDKQNSLRQIHDEKEKQRLLSQPPVDFFICCFSEEYDSLPMWKMYADDCKGLELGFVSKHLRDEHEQRQENITETLLFCSVIYDQEKYKEIVRYFLEAIVTFMAEREDRNWHFVEGICQQFAILSLSYKHRSFSCEKEWRFFINPLRHPEDINIEYKPSKGVFIYKANYLTRNADKLQHVRLGPFNPDTVESIRGYFLEIGSSCKPENIRKSDSTYRDTNLLAQQ